MRKRAIKLLSVLFITSSLLVALFPFFIVNAETATYYEMTGCIMYEHDTLRNRFWYISASSPVRFVVVSNNGSTTEGTVLLVSTSSFSYGTTFTSTDNSCPISQFSTSEAVTFNGGTYYVGQASNYDISTGFENTINVPINPKIYYQYSGNAIYYTYGAGAVDPAPPAPTYGDLIIDGYSTDIAGSGSAAIKNIDHIRWNPDFDINGNDISNLKVRLKIVPGNYIASRASDLLLQKYDDFIEDQFNSDETVYNASVGEATISWEYIVNKFDNIINRIYLFNMGLNADTWEKQGWLYKLRLEDESNDYIGDWQTVYSSTSSGVENDLNIVNNNSITQEFITTLQEINSINNVENNWIVNNTDVSVTNNYTEPQEGEKPWWSYLLESILNTFNITNNYIYEGDTNTQNITNTVNDSDDDMNRKIGEYQQFEDTFIDDMDSNLSDIDTDIDFLSDNKFISSANWVAQQYNRMTTNNVIGSFIGFSLLFGLALIFIGKIH